MEFCEKLQELRKSRGLTQEELAEALYVSRTAVSKWESGRGYPSIDSLKEISNYFSVTIDELLSGEKLIFIAEKENKSNIRNICDLLFGTADLLSFLLIVLPLYPKTVDGYIYSVNLWMYTETAAYNRTVYWILFLALMASGMIKILQTQLKTEKGQKTVTMCSVFLSIGTVLYLVLARETYAAAVAFLLMIMKGLLVFRHIKSD
ncbi:MAG: helix-turn-helix transcriptional regulator [Anaerotignum sp.]|nr:helix-turn-helix transcriptional regulator [Anaerotignum sp.]